MIVAVNEGSKLTLHRPTIELSGRLYSVRDRSFALSAHLTNSPERSVQKIYLVLPLIGELLLGEISRSCLFVCVDKNLDNNDNILLIECWIVEQCSSVIGTRSTLFTSLLFGNVCVISED